MTISLTTITAARRAVGADIDEDLMADFVQRDEDLAEMIFALVGVNGRTVLENSAVYTTTTVSLGSWNGIWIPDWAQVMTIRLRAKVSTGTATYFAELGTGGGLLTSATDTANNTAYAADEADPELALVFSDVSSHQGTEQPLAVKADGDTNPMTIYLKAVLGCINNIEA